jgi:hypothetical protein
MENTFFTVADIANELGITSVATNMRLQRKGRKPFKYIGSAGLYTKADLEAIRDGGQRGRPKAEIKPKAKPKKTVKKP